MIYDLFRDVNRLSQYQSWFQSDDFMYKKLKEKESFNCYSQRSYIRYMPIRRRNLSRKATTVASAELDGCTV